MTVIEVAKTITLSCASVCLLSIGILAAEVCDDLPNLNPTVVKLNQTLDAVNDPNPKRGTLRLLNKDLVDLGDLTKDADVAARATSLAASDESKALAAWNVTITSTLADTDTAVRTINESAVSLTAASAGALHQATDTMAHATPAIDALGGTFTASTATITRVNALLADPAIPKIIAHSESITDSGARIVKDGADEADKLAHPDKKKLTFWGGLDGAVLYFHSHIAPPLF